MTWQFVGFPTESGKYVCCLGPGQRDVVLHWLAGAQTDWRDGARKVQVRAFYGPLPVIGDAGVKP